MVGVGKQIKQREHCLDRPLALQWAFILLSQSFQLCLEVLPPYPLAWNSPSLLVPPLSPWIQISVQTKTPIECRGGLAVLGPASLPRVAASPSRQHPALAVGAPGDSGSSRIPRSWGCQHHPESSARIIQWQVWGSAKRKQEPQGPLAAKPKWSAESGNGVDSFSSQSILRRKQMQKFSFALFKSLRLFLTSEK